MVSSIKNRITGFIEFKNNKLKKLPYLLSKFWNILIYAQIKVLSNKSQLINFVTHKVKNRLSKWNNFEDLLFRSFSGYPPRKPSLIFRPLRFESLFKHKLCCTTFGNIDLSILKYFYANLALKFGTILEFAYEY